MLTSLFIENLAVIEKTYIDFEQGFNVFTGETGAGKSIVLDAINAVLGKRTSKEIVRNGTEKAVITAVFNNIPKQLVESLNQAGFETDQGELMIQREIYANGKSNARINLRPVTVSVLRELTEDLVNIHGQHDNQILLSPNKHIDILDSYSDTEETLAQYQEQFRAYKALQAEISKLTMDESEKERRLDILNFQVQEIGYANLQVGEDEQLEEKKQYIKNIEKIAKTARLCDSIMHGDDENSGAISKLEVLASQIDAIADYIPKDKNLHERLLSCIYDLQEISSDVDASFGADDFNENELELIEQRIDTILKLKRKYGDTIEEILEYYQKISAELETINLSSEKLKEYVDQREKLKDKIRAIGQKLTTEREKGAKKFSENVAEQLRFLDMPNVVLTVDIQKDKFSANGQDKVEFLISTNPGEPPKPISKIASGGELSRIMLAIKSALADKDKIPTLIFDEIDTGVSGKAAQKIGVKIREIAKDKQVICVTHLAQIASLCNCHFLIKKETIDNKTFTKVKKLDLEGRVQEVARIMGTDDVSQLTLQTAKEMIDKANSI